MTQAWEGKSKGTPLGYRIFIDLLRIAGVTPAYVLLRFVAFYYFVSASSFKHIYSFFRRRLGYGWLRSITGVYRNYYRLGQTLIDKIVVMSGMKVPFTFVFEGEHHIEDIMAGGRGGILISAHAGNYELAAYYFKRLPVRVNVVMVDREQQQIKEYLEKVLNDRQLNIITIKDDNSHIYEINAALGRNELIAMHADRYVAGSRTIEGTLFGGKAHFPIGPFVLATTFKVPVSYVFCFKETAKHYHLYSSPAREYTGPRQVAMAHALADYTQEVEAKLKMYPTQWFNYYDFWQS